ncbi:hypothetical protein [Nocardia cyriacigeorgica]|uniref:hypothetical protein n=1 Tax=Nocardia cyriacigeorgica TaxID=135487 RepID=UPI00189423DC|nr:hypothetical protein [Nocardia cyriacigeorgica]MBF6438843.1 hypothetical protein [Nocardia cyriacigeorgica]
MAQSFDRRVTVGYRAADRVQGLSPLAFVGWDGTDQLDLVLRMAHVEEFIRTSAPDLAELLGVSVWDARDLKSQLPDVLAAHAAAESGLAA